LGKGADMPSILPLERHSDKLLMACQHDFSMIVACQQSMRNRKRIVGQPAII
jgi:hypothetical protein